MHVRNTYTGVGEGRGRKGTTETRDYVRTAQFGVADPGIEGGGGATFEQERQSRETRRPDRDPAFCI